MDDLTKLSGPELADLVDPSMCTVEIEAMDEAARRLREDTREWQRRLERERDGLRAELAAVKAELHKWRNGHQLQAFQEELNEMHGRAVDAENERDGLRAELAQCKSTMAGMHAARGELQRAPWHGSGPFEWSAQPEPAERKAQEERRYGAEGYHMLTLEEVANQLSSFDDLDCLSHAMVSGVVAHLRETLATIDAVRAFSEEMSTFCSHHWANRLREVLNGKR